MQNENSGVNTVLLVIVLLIIVAAGVWWFRGVGTTQNNNVPDDINVDVNLPTGSGGESGGGDQSY